MGRFISLFLIWAAISLNSASQDYISLTALRNACLNEFQFEKIQGQSFSFKLIAETVSRTNSYNDGAYISNKYHYKIVGSEGLLEPTVVMYSNDDLVKDFNLPCKVVVSGKLYRTDVFEGCTLAYEVMVTTSSTDWSSYEPSIEPDGSYGVYEDFETNEWIVIIPSGKIKAGQTVKVKVLLGGSEDDESEDYEIKYYYFKANNVDNGRFTFIDVKTGKSAKSLGFKFVISKHK